MAIKKIVKTITVCECERCGYEWEPKNDEIPITCANPKCRTPYWDKIKKNKKKNKKKKH